MYWCRDVPSKGYTPTNDVCRSKTSPSFHIGVVQSTYTALLRGNKQSLTPPTQYPKDGRLLPVIPLPAVARVRVSPLKVAFPKRATFLSVPYRNPRGYLRTFKARHLSGGGGEGESIDWFRSYKTCCSSTVTVGYY